MPRSVASSMRNEAQQEQHQENEETNSRNLGRRKSDHSEAEDACNERYQQENQCVVQHEMSSFPKSALGATPTKGIST